MLKENEDRQPENGGLSMLAIRDMAMRAVIMIENHSKECEQRQIRYEKQQEEIKLNQRTNAETMTAKLDKTNDKVSALQWRLALIVGGMLGTAKIVEVVAAHL